MIGPTEAEIADFLASVQKDIEARGILVICRTCATIFGDKQGHKCVRVSGARKRRVAKIIKHLELMGLERVV